MHFNQIVQKLVFVCFSLGLVASRIPPRSSVSSRTILFFGRCKMIQTISKYFERIKRNNVLQKPQELLSLSLDLFNFVLPRLFGLLSVYYDSHAHRLRPSRGWLIYCNVIGHLFVCIYPVAFMQIIAHRTSHRDGDDSSVSRNIEIFQYAIMYVLSVAVFIRQMYFSKLQLSTVNRGLIFYHRCLALGDDGINGTTHIYAYFVRAIVSYIGYAVLNFFTIFHFYGEMPQVNFIYKIVFFMPNIAITTTTIRFHAAIMMLTVSGRRINRAFHDCIESVNRTQNRTRAQQQRACEKATDRFEFIITCHAEWDAIKRIMAQSLSVLMLFTVINNTINLTSTVS